MGSHVFHFHIQRFCSVWPRPAQLSPLIQMWFHFQEEIEWTISDFIGHTVSAIFYNLHAEPARSLMCLIQHVKFN